MIIAQLSDCHITARHKKTYGILPTRKNLQKYIKGINQQTPQPDVVLVTGDVTACGDAEQVEHAELLAQLVRPITFYRATTMTGTRYGHRSCLKCCPEKYEVFLNFVIDDHPIALSGLIAPYTAMKAMRPAQLGLNGLMTVWR